VSFDVSDAVLELMYRYERNEFYETVQRRLEAIFREYPDDAIDRLERAADYLKITGRGLQQVAHAPDRQAA
jgi:hypothetical protein